jgi:hypothetical protein
MSDKELSNLVNAVCNRTIDDEGMRKLEERLSAEREARSYFRRVMNLHAALHERTDGSAEFAYPEEVLGFSAGARRGSIYVGVTTAAACAVIGLVLWLFSTVGEVSDRRSSTEGKASVAQAREPAKIIATVGISEGAVWNLQHQALVRGARLGFGEMKLLAGRIRLDFNAGEKVTLEGPAEFELIDVDCLSLKSGKLVASVTPQGRGFTVILPNGAVVDLGTEFAINVDLNGENRVKVLNGEVVASSSNSQGHTVWEKTLGVGEEVSIHKNSPLVNVPVGGEFIEPLVSVIEPLLLGDGYTEEVIKSNPVGYWTFDEIGPGNLARNRIGAVALRLEGGAHVKHSCLRLGQGQQRGFAMSAEAFPNLNMERGCSLEFWAYSDSVSWQSAASLVVNGPKPKFAPGGVFHNPHLLLVERSGISGSNKNHIHPNFCMRALHRAPAGYFGGGNSYSNKSHLIHGWHHMTAVRSDGVLQIFVDGELAGQSHSNQPLDDQNYDLLLGRMHPLEDDFDARQWSGALDEIAIYDRALSADEVMRHYRAAEQIQLK